VLNKETKKIIVIWLIFAILFKGDFLYEIIYFLDNKSNDELIKNIEKATVSEDILTNKVGFFHWIG